MHGRAAMLLILLALSGCIEVFQQGLSHEEAESAPPIAFADDEASDQIVVMQVRAGVDWADFNVTGDRPAYYRLNDGVSRQFSPARQSAVGMGAVEAGDKIDFCVPQRSGLETRLLYTPQNVIIHVFTFESVDQHKWCG